MVSSLVHSNAPDFTAKAYLPDGTIGEVKLADYLYKKYIVLFFYPMDFSPLCPSEITAFEQDFLAFDQLDVQLFGISVDSVYVHQSWVSTPRESGGVGKLSYALLSDQNHRISRLYGVLLPDDTVTMRATFLIDKAGVVRHQSVNDVMLARNTSEVLRMVKIWQFYEQNGASCQANWQTPPEA